MRELHRWDLTPKEAAAVQRRLRERLILRRPERHVKVVGGVDVHFEGGKPLAAIVLFQFPELTPLVGTVARVDHPYPYIPGLLSFREGPAVLAAWEQLAQTPDLVLFDGQGIAHPRGFGLAAHLGLWLGTPSIGVAKSKLYGHFQEPAPERGSVADLWDEEDSEKRIGGVLRTRTDVRPVFVSPGHLMDVETSIELTLACCSRYRLPEPTRWAHRVADGAAFPPPSHGG